MEAFFLSLQNHIYVFLMSMTPVVELRGAIPLAYMLGLPWYEALISTVIGNSIVVPVVVLLGREILRIGKNLKFTKRLFNAVERRTLAKQDVIDKYSFWGLAILVAIPLPGTGAWTGALLAALLHMRVRDALLSCFTGVIIAGVVVTGVTYSLFNIF